MDEKDYENLDYNEKDGKEPYEKPYIEVIVKPSVGERTTPSLVVYPAHYKIYDEEENDDGQLSEEEKRRKIAEERLRIYQEQCEYYNYKKERAFNRTPLILALVGLILSVFFGMGICFSIPALIISAIRISKKASKTLKWALIISIITTFVCVLIFFSLGYALIVGIIEYSEMMEETQKILKLLIRV